MADSTNKRLSETELFFYEDRVCGEADLVYRYCLTLTLNHETAQKLLLLVFKDAAENLVTMLGSSTNSLRTTLFRIGYRLHKNAEKKASGGGSALIKFLSTLATDIRVALFAVDVAGLPIDQVAEVLDEEEHAVRKKLAMARQALLNDKNFA